MREIFFNESGLIRYGSKYTLHLVDPVPHDSYYVVAVRHKNTGRTINRTCRLDKQYFEPLEDEEFVVEFAL